jgi:hypothetical protein
MSKDEVTFRQNVESNTEILTAAKTLAASDSGKTFFLNAAGGFTVTLPSPQLGLRFNFIVKTAPTTAYILSTGGADIGVVSVNELETDTTEDGPYDDNADTINFVANIALAGDFMECYCDGTKFYFRGQTNADGAVTTATT